MRWGKEGGRGGKKGKGGRGEDKVLVEGSNPTLVIIFIFLL